MQFTKMEYQESIRTAINYYKTNLPTFEIEAEKYNIIKRALNEEYLSLKKIDLIQFLSEFEDICHKLFYKYCNETPNDEKAWNRR